MGRQGTDDLVTANGIGGKIAPTKVGRFRIEGPERNGLLETRGKRLRGDEIGGTRAVVVPKSMYYIVRRRITSHWAMSTVRSREGPVFLGGYTSVGDIAVQCVGGLRAKHIVLHIW